MKDQGSPLAAGDMGVYIVHGFNLFITAPSVSGLYLLDLLLPCF